MKSSKILLLLFFLFNFLYQKSFSHNWMSLEDASKRGLVKLTIKSKSGFTGDVIEMKIKNLSSQKLNLLLEAGRRLDSKQEAEQDILITQSQQFEVCKKEIKNINVFGMCCQAHKICPTKGADYSIGKMADSLLILLAEYINKNKYFTNHTAQQAVWVTSDHNSIGSICGGEKTIVNEFQKFVSKITGREIPLYEVYYSRNNLNEPLGKANKVEGVFEYFLSINSHLSIAIYNSDGKLVQLLFENYAHSKGEYKLYYTFRTRNLEQGTYFARAEVNGELLKEMKIEF